MCLAIPVKIESIGDLGMASCRVGESDTFIQVSMMLLDEDTGASVGDYVIVHAGFAIRKLDPLEAEESLKVLRQLAHHHFGEEAQF
ncbi:MAG: HypC/HybG/HupF family hydrogenase formation chaperone [Desulfovibrionaceae bacterium]